METKQKQGSRVCAALGGVFALEYVLLQLRSGGSLPEWLWFTGYTAAVILLPGCFWFETLGLARRFSALRLPVCLMLGTGFFVFVYCFAGRFGQVWLLRLLPLVPAAWQAARMLRRNGGRPAGIWASVPAPLMLLWGFACLIFGFYISVRNADPAYAGAICMDQDLLWNVGNAQAFQLTFPPQDIRFSEVRLAYHYLTEMLVGALAWASGCSAYRVFAFYFGPLVLAALLSCVYAFGLVFYREDRAKSLLLCFLLLFGGCASLWAAFGSVGGRFGNTVLIHLISNINAQGSAIIFITVFVGMFTLLLRSGFDCTPAEAAALLAAAFLMTFSKGPEAAIVICAFAITVLLVLLFQRPQHWVRFALLAAGCVGVFAAIYFGIFASGANTSVHWSNNSLTQSVLEPLFAGKYPGQPAYTAAVLLGGVLITLLMQPVQTLLYLTSLPGDVRRLPHLPPERLIARGAAVGGMMAYCILWHESSSQIYFAFVAFFFLDVLAADVFPRSGRLWRAVCGAVLAVGVASAVFLYGGVIWRGVQQLGANEGLWTYGDGKYSPATADDAAAMEWLRENSAPDSRFATNRIHTAAWRDDGISNLYSALSGRQAYMEGYTYAYTNEGVSAAVVAEKQAVNSTLFSAATSRQEILTLCSRYGIQYLVYSVAYPGEDSQLAGFPLVYDGTDVRIYQIGSNEETG